MVTDTKTKWSRRVPVPEPVWERLRGELPTESDALLFPGRKGGHCPWVSAAGYSTGHW